jgi:exoribonuclease R
MPDTTLTAPSIASHVTGDWDTVLHIDPDGCEDVDDVLGWRRLPDGGYEFGIGIADVAAWVPEGSVEDLSAKRAGQTLYVDGVAVTPMLPTSLSTRLASLRCDGVSRPVLMLLYVVRDGAVCGVRWSRECVTVTRSFTYESVLLDATVSAFLREALGVVTGTSVGDDPHVWIEKAMIAYNEAAALVLRGANAGILRRHEGRSSLEWGVLAAATGCAEVALLGMKAGQYVDAGVEGDVSHAGLGLAVYCHASSPLRRYADLINQRWLKHILCSEAAPNTPKSGSTRSIADHLNGRNRIAKEFDRNLAFLAHLRTDRVTEILGVVLCAKKDRVRWKVYVPAWKRTIAGRGDGITEGDRVTVRAYLNLAAPRWDDRLVCRLSPLIEEKPALVL